jgi:hypothetical protein
MFTSFNLFSTFSGYRIIPTILLEEENLSSRNPGCKFYAGRTYKIQYQGELALEGHYSIMAPK